MMGYRSEEWTDEQIKSCFKYPVRGDFYFKLAPSNLSTIDRAVATTLPIYLKDASLVAPCHRDKLTVLTGAIKRLGTRVPTCSFRDMKKILRYARKYIYPQFETIDMAEVPKTEDWIEQINHPEKRKQELRIALETLRKVGLITPPGVDQDDVAMCKSFIKCEKYEDLKPPRWINASSDLVKVACGALFDMIMDRVCRHPSAIKTVPVAERALYISNTLGGSDVIGQSSDAGSMEDHYANIPTEMRAIKNEPRYRIHNDFIMYMIGHVKPHKDLIDSMRFIFFTTTLKTKQPFELKHKLWTEIRDAVDMRAFCSAILDGYRKLGMRDFGLIVINAILCSGEMNTSLKNFISMFTMVNYAQYEISSGKHTTCKSVNEGDDALAVYHKGRGPDEDWWTRHGWIVKVEFVGKVNEAAFCQLIFDPVDLVSTPDIRKNLAKFGTTGRKYAAAHPNVLMQLLRAKAMSMACEYSDVPILGPLAHRILELTKNITIRKSIIYGMDLYERERLQLAIETKAWQKKPNIRTGTRQLVSKLQDLTVSQQLQAEAVVSCLGFGPFTLPGIDFNPIWVHNMSRFRSSRLVPYVPNIKGRKRVVEAIRERFRKDFYDINGIPHWPEMVPKYQEMYRLLNLLEKGSI